MYSIANVLALNAHVNLDGQFAGYWVEELSLKNLQKYVFQAVFCIENSAHWWFA